MSNAIQTEREPSRQFLMAMLEDGEWENVLVQATGQTASIPSRKDQQGLQDREIWREVDREGKLGKRLFYTSAGCGWEYTSALQQDPSGLMPSAHQAAAQCGYNEPTRYESEVTRYDS